MRNPKLSLSTTHYTETATGRVKHLSLISPYGEVLLPVALTMDPDRPQRLLQTARGVPYARRRGGRYVYALPGGGEFLW